MGDLAAAHERYAVALAGLERADHIADVLGCSIATADFELTLGRLDDAQRTFERALALAEREQPVLRGTADMLAGLARVALERYDLALATDCLSRAEELGSPPSCRRTRIAGGSAMARVREAEGDLDAALGLLDEADRVYVGDYSPNVQPVPAVRARVLAAKGDVPGALAWAQHHDLSAGDELSYLREYEHVTLARILLAQRSPDATRDATALLDRLLVAAEGGGRVGTVIEILVLQSLAQPARSRHWSGRSRSRSHTGGSGCSSARASRW